MEVLESDFSLFERINNLLNNLSNLLILKVKKYSLSTQIINRV